MLAIVVTAAFQDVDEALEIGIDIGMGMLQRVAHAGLRREMDHHGEATLSEQRLCRRTVGEVELHKAEVGLALEDIQARFLQLRIVIVVDDIEANDLPAGRQQPLRDVESDKPGGSGDQYRIVRHAISSAQSRHSSMPAGCEPRSSIILTSKTRPLPSASSF